VRLKFFPKLFTNLKRVFDSKSSITGKGGGADTRKKGGERGGEEGKGLLLLAFGFCFAENAVPSS